MGIYFFVNKITRTVLLIRFLTYDGDGQIAQLLKRGVEEKRRLEEERGENKRILEKGEEDNYKRESNFVEPNQQSSIQNKQVEHLFLKMAFLKGGGIKRITLRKI